MIRGITYDKQLFKSSDFSLMTKKFFNNNDGIVEGCSISKSGNNVVIGTGWFIASGYYTNIETEQILPISSGKLVYEIDLTKTNTTEIFNQGSFKIILGTPRKDDLFNGGTIYQLVFAEINGATITKKIGNIKGESITSDRFALLTGIVPGSSLSEDIQVTSRPLPEGFTYSNCVVISNMVNLGYSAYSEYQGRINGVINSDNTLDIIFYQAWGVDIEYKIVLMRID